MRLFNIIYARTPNGGIGYKNDIPWHDEDDLKHFRQVTENHIVIMGERTRKSIGKDLPNRLNLVVSKFNTLEFVLKTLCAEEHRDKEVFVIGGGILYNYCIGTYPHLIDKVYSTLIIDDTYECDTFVTDPPEHESWNYNLAQEFSTKKGNPIVLLLRINHDEGKYLELLREIYKSGNDRGDRTGVGTLSLFNKSLSFDLRDGILPLFTTKFVSFKNVLTELLWFIRGSSSLDFMHEHGCRIWDANVEQKGELGPMYPVQWRNRGGEVDQLANMVRLIKNDPHSRRILIDNWDVVNLDKMCLSPCHVLFQVYVNGDQLEGALFLRSSDTVLGLPYNVASYSILLHILATVTDKKAVRLHVTMGDTHIYKTHIKAVEEQIERVPRVFPVLFIDRTIKDIDHFEHKHFSIFDYNHSGKLKAQTPMAI